MRLTKAFIVDGRYNDFYQDLKTSAAYHQEKGKRLGFLHTNLARQTESPGGGREWHGKAQEAAHAWADHLGSLANSMADDFTNVGKSLDRFADAVTSCCGGMQSTILALAEKGGGVPFEVTDDLRVTDPHLDVALSKAADPAQMRQTRQQDVSTAQEAIDNYKSQLQSGVTSAANDIKSAFGHAEAAVPNGALVNKRIERGILDGSIEVPKDPDQLRKIWEDLTPEEKEQLYGLHHDIGNYGGIPFEDRDEYNRRHLKDLLEHATGDDLKKYQAVEAASRKGQAPPRLLGYVDDQRHAAVCINNPDKAKKNATFVPGTFADLNTMGRYDGDSWNLYNAARSRDASLGPDDVSVTTWIGYSAPPSLPEAADPSYARNGAQTLDDWQAGLRASHEGAPSYNTVIGHSYGSTLVGAAATSGHHLDADAVVAIGSPGMFAGNAAGLFLDPNSKVFVGKATYDPIGIANAANAHGVDPADWPDAFQFDTAPGSLLHPDDTHNGYFDMGKPGLDNMGGIVDGQDESNGVTHAK